MCAVDLKAGTGTAILAPADGKVVRTGFDSSGGGNFMVVEQDGRASLYLHLNKFVVSSGTVTQGQVIACSGTGGTGPHLHFSAMADTGLRSCVSMSGIDGNTSLSLGQTFSSSNQIVGTNPCSPSVTITPQPTLPPSGNPPNAPSLNSPSKDQAVSQETPITFEWGTSSNATQYLLEYSGGPYGTLNSGWQLATNYRVGTMWPGTYNWRSKARNSAGESAWSDTWTFTIQGPTQTPPPSPTKTTTPLPQSASAPSLRDPSNDASYPQSQDIWFAWNYVSNADQYYLEYWGGPYGTLNSGWINDVAYHIGTMWPGKYKWHVKARGQNGVESNWSNTWTFTITEPPVAAPTDTNRPPTAIPQPPTDTPRPSFTGNIAPRANRSPDGIGSGNAFDGDLSTFWTDGLGHAFSLELRLPDPLQVNRILVWDRPQNSPDNNQINALIIRLSNGMEGRFGMDSQGARCIDVTLSSPQTISSVTLKADDASGNNGLSEVEIWVGSKTGGPACSNSGVMP